MKRLNNQKPFGLLQRAFYVLLCGVFAFLVGCRPDLQKTKAEEFKVEIQGRAQGTTWRLVYYDLQSRNLKPEVDSILTNIDQSVSTYVSGSMIDRWNNSDSGSSIDPLFLELLKVSLRVYNATEGAFDPTVMPLVKFWGFGPEKFEHPENVDQQTIDSLRALLCFDQLRLVRNERTLELGSLLGDSLEADSLFLYKPFAAAQLDFNAVGQGWSVDKVMEYLETLDIKISFFELGGEIRAGSPKPSGELWRFGVDKPVDNDQQRELQAIVSLRNKGLATSGNYRKYYMKDGVRYAHTIDPKTGYPVKHNLLSATVISDDAATADAYATAFLVMGQDSTISFIEEKTYLNNYVYLISTNDSGYSTYVSPQIAPMIEETEP